MNHELFEHRTSRAIAASRLGLAILFGLLVWADPQQPARGGMTAELLYVLYLTISLVLVRIAWANWWLDFRTGLAASLVDGAAFFMGIYCTEGPMVGFFSPFLTFMLFILISAGLRFGRRAAIASAAGLSFAYLVATQAFLPFGFEADVFIILRHFSYMIVLSMLFAWFGMRYGLPALPRFGVQPPSSGLTPSAQALEFAMLVSHARGGALVWAPGESRFTNIELGGTLRSQGAKPDPGDIDPAAMQPPLLFDISRRRSLALLPDNILRANSGMSVPAIIGLAGASEGLFVEITGRTGRGQLVLSDISGMSVDDIRLAKGLAQEIALGLDAEEIASASRASAVERSRAALARDLHDSVAQTLAGTSFRLQALRQKLPVEADVAQDVDAIIADLGGEQAQVRSIIENLRQSEAEPGTRNMATEIAALLAALSRTWGVDARLDPPPPPLIVPAWFGFEIQQLVREGVANAARHGAARLVTVSLGLEGGQLTVQISNDGPAAVGEAKEIRPRTLTERVTNLGGTLRVGSDTGLTLIEIALPFRGKT